MNKLKIIKLEAEELLTKLINQFEVEVKEEEGVFHIIIKTPNEAPTVIGRYGETIRALQKIFEVILYKKFNESVNLLVNVNDYQEKQKARLETLAAQYAQKTQTSKEASYIRGLSSYERKIVHEYITKNYPELTTYSIGEGRDRRLVVDIKNNQSTR